MIKKALPFLLVIVILSLVMPAFGASQEPIVIYPWQIPVNQNGERVVTVMRGQPVVLGANWGACTRGLVSAFALTSDISYIIDGRPVLRYPRLSRLYWEFPPEPVTFPGASACVNRTTQVWTLTWAYDLKQLSLGDHPAHFSYKNDYVHIDGFDNDGDGKPDKFNFALQVDFVIRVVE
jgi:hypothetical protein